LLRDLEKREVLFEDGEEGSSMFITLSGNLVVWKN
jgi:CRP-like cAMP-binding protein